MNLVCSSRSISQQFEMVPCIFCLQKLHSPLPRAVVQFKDSAGQVWLDICKVSPLKRQVAVQRRIGIFVRRIKDAIRLKKEFNLRLQAARFRDTHGEEQPYEIATLFNHFTPDFQRRLSPDAWDDVQSRLFRCTLDAEFLEKVSIKDQAITVLSFRFLQQHGITTARPKSSVQLAEIEASAIKAKEMSELTVVEVAGPRRVEQPSRTIKSYRSTASSAVQIEPSG